jgi:signal transduction histidine kinase
VLLTNATLVARLRGALRDREEYLSVVSHELKNSIAAIQAYTQLAVRRSNAADDRLQQTLDRIEVQTQRLRRLVDDLLSLSRIDTGHFQLERELTDLNALAAQAVESARESFSDYRFSLQATEPIAAMVDSARLLQVLDNLIHNAVKYSSPGAEVRVELRRNDRQVELAVQDQGIGIAPEDRHRIFSRFYRVPGSEERAPGLGIGLSVVAELVRAHGGWVDVHSTPGQGSEFVVVLPT